MRERVGEVDRDLVRLGDDVSSGHMDADDFKRRYVALERKLETRREDVELWRVYLYPPRTLRGRLVSALAGRLATWARRLG